MLGLRAIFLMAVVGAFASMLSATSALKLELETLIEKSDVIVIGKVDSKEARWDAKKLGIWTHHDVSVSETLKGEHEKTRDVVTRGGVVGRVGQHVAGTPTLNKGEEYVFFLWEDDEGRLRLTGMVQGAFRVTDKEGVDYAKNATAGLTIIDPDTMQPAKDKASRLPLEYKLSDLKTEVKDAVKAAKEEE